MTLNSSLSIASSGLAALQSEMAVASQNVANADTAGYVVETSSVSSRTADGQAGGVVLGLTTRTVDNALESSLYIQNAEVSALTTTTNALAPISALQGSTSADSGSSDTLSDDVGNLQTSLTTLEADPSNSAGQQAVLTAAGYLTENIRNTSAAYQAQRQSAQEAIVSDVATANTSLNLIGSLSQQIAGDRIDGISSADLENQRASAMAALSNVLSVNFSETASGDMLVSTANGLPLPTRSTSGPLSTSDATVTASSAYLAALPNALPAITIAGRDVTTSLTGGTLGANIALRDQILPTMQAELDSYSQALATRFDAQGLTLFTNGTSPSTSDGVTKTGTPSAASEPGFAGVIQVNPAVTADPSMIRDGSHDVTASSSGASGFTVNTDRGTDDTTLIDRLLNYSLGADVQTGVPQATAASTGLGVNGTLSTPYAGTSDLLSLAATLTSSQALTISQTGSDLTNATAVQTSITSAIGSVSGVSIDDEMSSIVALQNAYQANAKVVTAVQTMFTALLTAIT